MFCFFLNGTLLEKFHLVCQVSNSVTAELQVFSTGVKFNQSGTEEVFLLMLRFMIIFWLTLSVWFDDVIWKQNLFQHLSSVSPTSADIRVVLVSSLISLCVHRRAKCINAGKKPIDQLNHFKKAGGVVFSLLISRYMNTHKSRKFFKSLQVFLKRGTRVWFSVSALNGLVCAGLFLW